MTTLKQGDLVKDCEGDTRKILGVCGEVLFISWTDNHGWFSRTGTEADLKADGYTWDTPAWEPEKSNIYWFSDERGNVYDSIWDNDQSDHNRRDFLGIYETEEQLKENGFTWDTPAWAPEKSNIYWFIDERGNVYDSIWDNDQADHNRRDFLGIYQTEELAKAALLEIRRKLGK